MATPPERGSRWSAEARVLLRRPLLFAFVLGCAVSAAGSGRFSLDLIADGMVSFAFVPAGELAAFAIVYWYWYWIGRRRSGAGLEPLPFAQAADAFFVGNAPWLLWVVVLLAAAVVVTPRESMSLFMPAIYSSVVPLTWAAYLDFQFFRRVMSRTAGAALAHVVVYRAIAWSLILGYFLGIALVPELAWVTR